MKKAILLLVFLSWTFYSKSQEWFPSEAKWHYNAESWFPIVYSYVVSIEVVEEIIIQGKTCKRVIGGCSCSEFGPDNIICPEGDIVWRYVPQADTFSILYDFTLQAGDTLKHVIFEEAGHHIIDSVTTMIINGNEIRVQHFSYGKGIGSYVGGKAYEFFGYEQCIYPQFGACDPPTGPIRCYEDDVFGLVKISHPDAPCDTILSANYVQLSPVIVFPNPASNIVFISSESPVITFILTDFLGKPVIIKRGTDLNYCSIENLSDGYYIAQIRTLDGRVVTKSILVAH